MARVTCHERVNHAVFSFRQKSILAPPWHLGSLLFHFRHDFHLMPLSWESHTHIIPTYLDNQRTSATPCPRNHTPTSSYIYLDNQRTSATPCPLRVEHSRLRQHLYMGVIYGSDRYFSLNRSTVTLTTSLTGSDNNSSNLNRTMIVLLDLCIDRCLMLNDIPELCTFLEFLSPSCRRHAFFTIVPSLSTTNSHLPGQSVPMRIRCYTSKQVGLQILLRKIRSDPVLNHVDQCPRLIMLSGLPSFSVTLTSLHQILSSPHHSSSRACTFLLQI